MHHARKRDFRGERVCFRQFYHAHKVLLFSMELNLKCKNLSGDYINCKVLHTTTISKRTFVFLG